MRLTTKGRYAVTAILDIAQHGNDSPVAISSVSSRQGISQSYLEQLFSKLKKAMLVRSIRGPGGGYELALNPDAISVSDILTAVGEGVDATQCGGVGNCHEGKVCLTHELWTDLSIQIDLFLSSITVWALINRTDVTTFSDGMSGVDLIEARLV